MIINDKSANERLNSPFNLMNKLKNSSRKNAMSLFIPASPKKEQENHKETSSIIKEQTVRESFNPFSSESTGAFKGENIPNLDNLIENNETQIKLTQAHDKALELLNNSVAILSAKLDDIRPDRLPQVIVASGKIVESIRRERNEARKNGTEKEVHYHFYTPKQKNISDYAVIDVTS